MKQVSLNNDNILLNANSIYIYNKSVDDDSKESILEITTGSIAVKANSTFTKSVSINGSFTANNNFLVGSTQGSYAYISSDKHNITIKPCTTGSLNLLGNKINIGESTGSLNLKGSTINLSGSVYLNGDLLKNGIGSTWSGYSDIMISTVTGGTIHLTSYGNNYGLMLSGSSLLFSGGGNINITGSDINVNGKDIKITGSDFKLDTTHLKISSGGQNTYITWNTGANMYLNGQKIGINANIEYTGSSILGSNIQVNGGGSGSMSITGYNTVFIYANGDNAMAKFGILNNHYIEASDNFLTICAGYTTGHTGTIDLFSRDGEIKLRGSSINITSGIFTIKDGANTYKFSGGSFVLQQ